MGCAEAPLVFEASFWFLMLVAGGVLTEFSCIKAVFFPSKLTKTIQNCYPILDEGQP